MREAVEHERLFATMHYRNPHLVCCLLLYFVSSQTACVFCRQPPIDGVVGRPIRRTASELQTGQNIRRPDLVDHAATRLAQLSSVGGGATVRLSTVGDDDEDDAEEAAVETKPVPVVVSPRANQPWAVIDSDRSFLGNGM